MYGAIWLLDMTNEVKEACNHFSLVQARALFEDAKFTQVFPNLTGGFITMDSGVVQIMKAHMTWLKEGGTCLDNPLSELTSHIDFKVLQALSWLHLLWTCQQLDSKTSAPHGAGNIGGCHWILC